MKTFALVLFSALSLWAQSQHQLEIIPNGVTVGQVCFLEPLSGTTHKVCLKVPSSLAADTNVFFPDAGVGSFIIPGRELDNTWTGSNKFNETNLTMNRALAATTQGLVWSVGDATNVAGAWTLKTNASGDLVVASPIGGVLTEWLTFSYANQALVPTVDGIGFLGMNGNFFNNTFTKYLTLNGISGSGGVLSHLNPSVNNTWDFGSLTHRWRTYYGDAMDITGAISMGQAIEVNSAGTGDRVSFVDFHAEDVTYTDFALRLHRASGANGVSTLTHRGTGALKFETLEASGIQFATTNTSRFEITSDGHLLPATTAVSNAGSAALRLGTVYGVHGDFAVTGTADTLLKGRIHHFVDKAGGAGSWDSWANAVAATSDWRIRDDSGFTVIDATRKVTSTQQNYMRIYADLLPEDADGGGGVFATPTLGRDGTRWYGYLSTADVTTVTTTNLTLALGGLITNNGARLAGNWNAQTAGAGSVGTSTYYYSNMQALTGNFNTIGLASVAATYITFNASIYPGSTYSLGGSSNRWGLYATTGNFAGTIQPSAPNTYENGTSTADWSAVYTYNNYVRTGHYVFDGTFSNVRFSQISGLGTWYANDGTTGATIAGNTKLIRSYGNVRADGVFNLNGTDGATVTLDCAAGESVRDLTVVGGIITAASCSAP